MESDQLLEKKILNFISENELEEACHAFKPTYVRKLALNLRAQLIELEEQKNQNLVTNEDYLVKKNKIRETLIQYASQLADNPIKKKLHAYRVDFHDHWIAGIFCVLTLIILGATLVWMMSKDALLIENEIETMPQKDIVTVQKSLHSLFSNENAYHILLLPFGPDGNCVLENNQYHWQVQRRLNDLNTSQNLNLEIKRQDTILCDLIILDSVKSYGNQLGADLVIYGNYQERCEWDTTLLNIQYVSLDTAIFKPRLFEEGKSEYVVHDKASLNSLKSGKFTGTIEDVMYWALGIREYNSQNYQKAIYYFTNISTIGDKFAYLDVFQYLGNSYLNLEKYDSALINYNKVINLKPENASIRGNRGLIYYYLDQHEKALVDLNQAISFHQQHEDTLKDGSISSFDFEYTFFYYCRGLIYYDLNQPEKALPDFEKTIKLYYDKMTGFKSRDPFVYLYRGNTYNFLKDYEKALGDYNTARALGLKNFESYLEGELSYWELSNYFRSVWDYHRNIQRWPMNAYSYFDRGNFYVEYKKYEEAINDYNKFIELSVEVPPQIYSLRGINYHRTKQYQKAIQDFTRAIRLVPDDAGAYESRGSTYNSLGQYNNALADFNKAIKLDINRVTAYNLKGLLFYDLGQYYKALHIFDKAIKINPNSADSYYHRGLVYNRLRASHKALTDFNKALELNPNHEDAHYNQELIYHKVEKPIQSN